MSRFGTTLPTLSSSWILFVWLFVLGVTPNDNHHVSHAWVVVPTTTRRRRRRRCCNCVGTNTITRSGITSITAATIATTTTTCGMGAADDLLYQEQEKMLVNRGAWEGQLMADTHSPLKAHVVKGAGSKGGFGAKASSSSSSTALKTQAKELAKVLKKHGVVRIDKVLSDSTADALRSFLYDLRHESEALVADGSISPIQRFADVLLKQNRCDMPVPLGPDIVTTALEEVLLQSPVGGVVQNLLTPQAVLYELSCLMSDPGSQRQVVHPDTPYNPHSDEPVLYTCFIALQDITLDMGPTTWLPDTHTLEIHEQFQDDTVPANDGTTESPKDTLLRTRPSVLGTLPKGSCGMYDSRLLHCGGANQSDTSRALFYMSFRNPQITAVGNPGSIRRDMIGKWTLQALQKELKLTAKGKPSGNLVSEP